MLFEMLAISLGVSMDAFAVSISKGLSIRRTTARQCLTVALWLGGFQALFPLFGYFAAAGFRSYITSIDHWIIFGLLSALGVNMIREALAVQSDEKHRVASSFGWRSMLPLAIATSIDAFAVGIGISVVSEGIWPIIISIGIMTAAMSVAGLQIGNVFGARWRKPAQICGGSVLILLGLEILLDHLGFFEALRSILF
ncbi:manganese efflux pump MntP family protein [Bifidobacterium aquikefiricola]|uniref:Putative manganese efflux pump MntP n=1 Tax=Bifidobacterium aquikefiricola TaxID=3059038 RepID=A0AB39U5H1_9BIFI